MNEKDKIFYLVSALLDKKRRWVQILSPQTLDQATDMAQKNETFYVEELKEDQLKEKNDNENKTVNIFSLQKNEESGSEQESDEYETE